MRSNPNSRATKAVFDQLPCRTVNRVARAGIRSLAQLRGAKDVRLLSIPGFGPTMLAQVDALVPDRRRGSRRTRVPAWMRQKVRRALARRHDIDTRSALASPLRANELRMVIAQQLRSQQALALGWQSQLAREYGVSRQRVHWLVVISRRKHLVHS